MATTKNIYTKEKVDSLLANKADKSSITGLSQATSTTLGTVKLGSDTTQTTSANSVSSTSGRTYAIQKNSSEQLVVNVPWTNTTPNTYYTYVNSATQTNANTSAGGTTPYTAGATFYRNFVCNGASTTRSTKILCRSFQIGGNSKVTCNFGYSYTNRPNVYITEWSSGQPSNSAYTGSLMLDSVSSSSCVVKSIISETVYVSILVIGY